MSEQGKTKITAMATIKIVVGEADSERLEFTYTVRFGNACLVINLISFRRLAMGDQDWQSKQAWGCDAIDTIPLADVRRYESTHHLRTRLFCELCDTARHEYQGINEGVWE